MSEILKDISIVCKRLLTMESFYGLFSIGLNKVINTEIKTIGVSKEGINCKLTTNPDFWGSLSDKHKLGIIKHELIHIAFNHILNFQDFEDKILFNIAADLEVNQYIEKDLLPEYALSLEKYGLANENKKGTKYYYEKLKEQLNTGKNPALDALYNSMKEGNKTICSHDTWKEFEDISEGERKVIKEQIEEYTKDIVEAAKLQGNIPRELADWIERILLNVPPVIDWRSLFRRQVGGTTEVFTRKTRRKQSRRLPDYPGIKVKTKPLAAIYWDISGSVSEEEHTRFFTEINYMHKAGVNFDIYPFNTKVLKGYRYKKQSKAPSGGGGTSFTPISNHFNKRSTDYALAIILTDGYAECPPKFKKPVIWIITPEGRGIGLENIKEFPGVKIKMNKQ